MWFIDGIITVIATPGHCNEHNYFDSNYIDLIYSNFFLEF